MGDLLRHSIDLEDRVRWLEKAMKEILDCCDLKNTFILSSDDTAFACDIKDGEKNLETGNKNEEEIRTGPQACDDCID